MSDGWMCDLRFNARVFGTFINTRSYCLEVGSAQGLHLIHHGGLLLKWYLFFRMRRYSTSLLISMSLIFAACGGGGNETTKNTNPSTTRVLKGTVPGTLIEAFCEDGSYHSVKSQNNGTSKHPFELRLPINLSCRLVMTTNEEDLLEKVVTPINFTSQFGPSSIAFKTTNDIDLGFIDLALKRSEMMQDNNQDGVEDIPKDLVLNSTESQNIEIQILENDPLDTDGDDIINLFEDSDNDKISNYDDDDDDGDGIVDSEDNDHDNDGVSDDDFDHDGIKNSDDIDDDNDSESDEIDDDDDNDGEKDSIDSDDDNDGIPDDEEDETNENEEESEDEEDSNEENDDESSENDPSVPSTPGSLSAGRLLAAQCAQCHGTDGISTTDIDSLAGESEAEIIEEMIEMRSDNDNELMHLQARGYTDEQIGLIAEYFVGIKGGSKDEGEDDD
ncbi:hypothetical protein GQR58_010592 [Nymphon striatum]|nr:hypothetical protein GQR58_010592 [Nymphon striatum]